MRRFFSSCFVMALLACNSTGMSSGPGTGNDASSSSSTSSSADCPLEARALAPGENTAYGFTLAQFVAAVEGERRAVLAWDGGPMDTPPKGGKTALTVTIRRTGEGTYLVPVTAAPSGACQPKVRVPVEVRFVTADGGFDETWTATAGLAAGPVFQLNGHFSIDLLAMPARGTFRIAPRTLGPGENAVLLLGCTVGADTISGTILAGVERRSDGGSSGAGNVVARWGPP